MAEFVRMPSTMWTQIGQAGKGGKEALDLLLRKYRAPILAFIRNAGFSAEDAEDLTQEVFLTLIHDDVLRKADREKGKFRSLLLAIARHAVSARRRSQGRVKRGGEHKHVSLEGGGEPAPLAGFLDEPAEDDTFDHLWIQNLVLLGMQRLQEECAKEGKQYYEALAIFTKEGLGYPEIAEKLGVKPGDVKNYIHRGRTRLKELVLEEVRAYTSSWTEFGAEVKTLMKYLE